jgi:hypothetical protein
MHWQLAGAGGSGLWRLQMVVLVYRRRWWIGGRQLVGGVRHWLDGGKRGSIATYAFGLTPGVFFERAL